MGCTSSVPVDPAAEARSKEIDKMLKEVSYLSKSHIHPSR